MGHFTEVLINVFLKVLTGVYETYSHLQSELRREVLGELISLYYTTFLVSVRSLNIPDDIFSMEELFVEIEDHIV